MRLLYLATVAFVVSIGLNDADTPKVLRSDFSVIEYQPTNYISTTVSRLLRSSSAADKRLTEERAGIITVSVFEKIKSAFTSSKVTPKTLDSWLKNGKSSDAVFTRLHLDKRRFPIFEPQFGVWVQYADELGAKFPEMSAISTLIRQYGDDKLLDMIRFAKMDPPTLKLATKLEMDQMQHWLTTRKDPDEVFQLLQLNMAGSNIFEKAAFPTWVKYVDDLNSKYPEDPTWMYTTLAKYVNDNVLFQMTYVAKKSENTKAIATKVEDEWFQSGLQNRKTPAKALLNLELGTTADSGLESLLLSTWARYTEVFGRRYPEEKSTMIETLTKNFDDFDVTKILHIAKTEELTNPLATKLEAAQLKLWLNSGKSTDDIFKLLKLDQDINDYSFQDKILLSTWVSYLDLFITKHPDKKDVLFSALEFRLNDRPFNEIISMAKKFSSLESTAIRIQNSQFPSFLASNKSPRNVFTLLRLADEGDDILGTPVFQMWMKYVEDFNKRNPARKESWFNPIRIECEWGGIRMIDKAMQNPSTVDIGKKLEREWLNYWLDEGNTPEVVFRWLNLVKAGGRALADRKFKTWTSYLDEFSKKYPTEAITVIDGLRANYNDINLLGVFKEAKNNPTTEKLTINLENALIDKWVAEKKSVEFLQKQLGHVDTSKDMIQRFTAKLEKIRNHTS